MVHSKLMFEDQQPDDVTIERCKTIIVLKAVNNYLTATVDTFIKELKETFNNVNLEIPTKQREMVLTKIEAVRKFLYSMICPLCQKSNPLKFNMLDQLQYPDGGMENAKDLTITIIYICLKIPTTSSVFNDEIFVEFDNLIVRYPQLDSSNIRILHERKIIEALLNLENETVVADGHQIKFQSCILLQWLEYGLIKQFTSYIEYLYKICSGLPLSDINWK